MSTSACQSEPSPTPLLHNVRTYATCLSEPTTHLHECKPVCMQDSVSIPKPEQLANLAGIWLDLQVSALPIERRFSINCSRHVRPWQRTKHIQSAMATPRWHACVTFWLICASARSTRRRYKTIDIRDMFDSIMVESNALKDYEKIPNVLYTKRPDGYMHMQDLNKLRRTQQADDTTRLRNEWAMRW